MDSRKTGELIYKLRKEKNLTQKELGELLFVSDKAVSKWERGLGYPDISLLTEISRVFQITLENIMSGEINTNEKGDAMKKIKFYICPECGNILTSTGNGEISCCARKLEELSAEKALEEDKLNVEMIDNEYYISSSHEMKKDHYISFAAFVNGDTLILRKFYPEWDLETRLPKLSRGILYWYCSRHGLYYQYLK